MRLVFFVIFALQLELLNAQIFLPYFYSVPTLNHVFHKGTAVLVNGQRLDGLFKFDTGFDPFKGVKTGELKYKQNYEKTSRESKIPFTEVKTLTLKDREKEYVRSYASDSTRFEGFADMKTLLRVVLDSPITMYDNSTRIYESGNEGIIRSIYARKGNSHLKRIDYLVDLKNFTKDQPYFIEQGLYTGKAAVTDLLYFINIMEIYNASEPLKILQWDSMMLWLNNGDSLPGWGLIQSADVNILCENSTDDAVVHFYDGQDFKIYTQSQVIRIRQSGKLYEPIFWNKHAITLFAHTWKNPEGNSYRVYRELINKHNDFNYSSEDRTLKFLDKNKKGNWKLANGQKVLREAYINANQ